MPAAKWEEFARQLGDASVRKHELWLYRARDAFEEAHRAGLLSEDRYHDLMGVLYGHLGRHAEGVEHGRRAVAGGDSPIYQYNLAVSLVAEDELDEAIELFRAASADADTAVDALTSQASVYAELGEWAAARKAYRGAMERLDPRNPDELWRASIAADRVGLPSDAVRLFALHLAVRQGVDTALADADPLLFVMSASNDVLARLPDLVPQDSIARLLVLRSNDPVFPAEAADPAPGEEVREAWAPYRKRANAAVIDAE